MPRTFPCFLLAFAVALIWPGALDSGSPVGAALPTLAQPPAGEPAPTWGASAGRILAGQAMAMPADGPSWRELLEAVPPVQSKARGHIESTWLGIKRIRDPERQHREIARSGIERWICDDLVDLRSWEAEGLPPFRWRDRIRDRTWSSPTLAAVLVRAYADLRRERPGVFLSVGDLAQPGCGQLEYGTLVRWVADDPADRAATALLSRARLYAGIPTVVEESRAANFLLEWERFEHPLAPVRVAHRIVGRDTTADGSLRLRVETRRYRGFRVADDEVRDDALETISRVLGHGVRVRSRQVPSWSPEEGTRTLWHQHWIDPRSRRQVVTLSRERMWTSLVPEAVEEVRVSGWRRNKPRSFPGEDLWRPEPAGDEGEVLRWRVASSLYEAGHATHLAGRDADVSYVTKDNVSHFAVDPETLDVEGSWAWFRALDRAARELGAEIDRILVDPSIKRILAAGLSAEAKATVLWRERIRLARGHTAHHHLRLAPADQEAEARARKILAGLSTGEAVAERGE